MFGGVWNDNGATLKSICATLDSFGVKSCTKVVRSATPFLGIVERTIFGTCSVAFEIAMEALALNLRGSGFFWG